MTALWLFGVLFIVSMAYIGVEIGVYLNGGLSDMAYWFGMFFVIGVSSAIGFITIIIQENAQDIKVKIVKEG